MSKGSVNAFAWTWSRPSGIDLDHFVKYLEPLKECVNRLFDKWVFQREQTIRPPTDVLPGDNDHYQGFGHVKERVRATTMGARFKTLLQECVNEFVKAPDGMAVAIGGIWCKEAHSPQALRDYVMKAVSRKAGPWMDKAASEEHVDDSPFIKAGQLLPWQAHAIEIITAPANDRSAIVISDFVGNGGKSQLAKHLRFKYGALYFNAMSSAKHILQHVAISGWHPIYVINLPKALPTSKGFDWAALITLLEQLKDGDYTTEMWQPVARARKTATVLLMTNALFPQWLLSGDRTVKTYFKLEDGKDGKELVTMTPELVDAHRHEWKMAKWALELEAKREKAEKKEYFAKFQAGKLTGDSVFNRVAADRLSKPPPLDLKTKAPSSSSASVSSAPADVVKTSDEMFSFAASDVASGLADDDRLVCNFDTFSADDLVYTLGALYRSAKRRKMF